MSSLHDELLDDTRGGACKVCTFLARQSLTAREEWQRELALPATSSVTGEDHVAHAAIVVALKRRGVAIEEASVRRHRANHAR